MKETDIQEKRLRPLNGWIMVLVNLILIAAGIAAIIVGVSKGSAIIAVGVLLIVISIVLALGFKVLNPNEAYVLTLFGKYYGSIKNAGFYWVIPFCSPFNPVYIGLATQIDAATNIANGSNIENQQTQGIHTKKISLKAMTLNNGKQKVNDSEGNPIEIGVVVIWKIVDTAKAVFQVDNYQSYISTQADAVIRNIARQYPYDIATDGDEKSLRGSSQEIAKMLCEELQERVNVAGIEIIEARISHLAYSQEIAAAMLQRQQAKAVVDARTKIVEGAVGMVELALDKLKESGCVDLNNEMKAKMVSNLMVVLCSNKDTQPVVNSGHIE